MSTDPQAEPLALAFLERFWADQDAGREVDLVSYLELFPDHDETIAVEFLNALAELRGEGDGDETVETNEEQLGPYRLVRELGRGGQGIVWLAEDTRLNNRKVALKVLTGLGPGAEGHLARFKREAALASKLEHPGICGVHDTGIESGVPYIAMRYVDGETLGERLSRSPLRGDRAGGQSSFVSFDDEDDSTTSGSSKTGHVHRCFVDRRGRNSTAPSPRSRRSPRHSTPLTRSASSTATSSPAIS